MKQLANPAHLVWALVALTTGCATYRPAPIEPLRVLEGLEAIEWNPGTQPPDVTTDGTETAVVGPRELSAFAVSTNPQLAAARAEVGVRGALLVEAGLLLTHSSAGTRWMSWRRKLSTEHRRPWTPSRASA